MNALGEVTQMCAAGGLEVKPWFAVEACAVLRDLTAGAALDVS